MNEQIEEIILRALNEDEQNKIEHLAADENLYLRGLNSVTIITILVELEETFEVEFDDDMLDPENFETINSIVACINSMKLQ